jgi:hypothetical protein
MRKAILFGLVLVTALFVAPSCRQLSAVEWPKVVQCGPDVEDVVGAVTRVLFGEGNVHDELSDMARVHGTETILCIVDELREAWTAPGAAQTPERIHGAQSAAKFLGDVGTEIQRAD